MQLRQPNAAGIVYDPSGEPVESAFIDVHSTNWTFFSWSMTDEEGHFNVTAPPGDYVARANPPFGSAFSGSAEVSFTIDSDGSLNEHNTSTHNPFGTGKLDFDKLAPALLKAGVPHDWWAVDLCFWPNAWDVTADVHAGTRAWMVRMADESRSGEVWYHARESLEETGHPDLAPRLVLEFASPPP